MFCFCSVSIVGERGLLCRPSDRHFVADNLCLFDGSEAISGLASRGAQDPRLMAAAQNHQESQRRIAEKTRLVAFRRGFLERGVARRPIALINFLKLYVCFGIFGRFRVDERSADSSIGRDDFFRLVFSFLRLDL